MTPSMLLSYDPALDVYTVVVRATLDSEAAFDAWSREVARTFAPLDGKRVDLFVDITDVHLEPVYAARYGQAMRAFAEKHVRHLVRYGAADSSTKSRMLLSAMANRYAANVCASREEAVAALMKLRGPRAAG